jgi:hypothetical protein
VVWDAGLDGDFAAEPFEAVEVVAGLAMRRISAALNGEQ